MAVPRYTDLFNPLLQALRELGGSASIDELEQRVADLLELSEEDLAEPHRGSRSKFGYNLAWARTYLKRYGLIDNSSRGIWSLTPKGRSVQQVDEAEVRRTVVEEDRLRRENRQESSDEIEEGGEGGEESDWEVVLLNTLKDLPPDAFERLCQRLLRESGFIKVEVTGRSGDGGIDGRGVVKLGSLLSFHVHFQCKRYRDTVSSPVVRDFRGAMVGRADKGIIMTTGSFTRDARAEALRDGAPPLDLVDGEDLVRMLKANRMGVEVRERVIEEVRVNTGWFEQL